MFRFSLTRCWDLRKGRVLFVMLNPSTADSMQDDPTIRRCISFAIEWGFGSLEVVNLYAYRATKPAALEQVPFEMAVGLGNDAKITQAAKRANLIVAAWGAHPMAAKRAPQVLELLRGFDVMCLNRTKAGAPSHPLYQRRDTQLKRYTTGVMGI